MALTRLPVGKLRDDPDIAPHFTTAYEEVAAVGRAAGDPAARRCRGKMAELQPQRPAAPHALDGASTCCAAIASSCPGCPARWWRLGRKLGVPTPTHAMIYAALKPYVDGAPG